jgi:hypothetical protein
MTQSGRLVTGSGLGEIDRLDVTLRLFHLRPGNGGRACEDCKVSADREMDDDFKACAVGIIIIGECAPETADLNTDDRVGACVETLRAIEHIQGDGIGLYAAIFALETSFGDISENSFCTFRCMKPGIAEQPLQLDLGFFEANFA